MSIRNPIEVSRNFVIEDGLGILDIQGEAGFSGAFLFKEHLLTTVWNQFSGSIMQWFVNSPHHQYRSIGQHFHAVSNYEINANNLEEIVSPLVKLFPNGEYIVSVQEFSLDSEFWVANLAPAYGFLFWETYPNNDVIVKTLSEDNLDLDCVKKWRQKISSGERPAIILAKSPNEDGFHCYFLIDGHHRINAYLEEKVCPRAIVIEKLNPSRISISGLAKLDVLNAFKDAKFFSTRLPQNKIYLRELHDQIITDIDFNWSKGNLEIELRSQVLRFSGVTDYQAQRKLPWGFSNSINEAKITQSSEQKILELEMQSGDKIIIHYTESNLIS